ncbi:unnamed protein product [Hymenolepis diminuta]|nr:unnamed protein product [Hymenolepis diminuta]
MLAIGTGSMGMIHLLLTLGADRNFKDIQGNTTLHWAVSSNNLEVVKLFYDPNVAETCTNLDGRTPLITAVSYNYFEVVNFMVQNGIDAYHIVTNYFDALDNGNEKSVGRRPTSNCPPKLHTRMSALNLDTTRDSQIIRNFVQKSVFGVFGFDDYDGEGSLINDLIDIQRQRKELKTLGRFAPYNGDALNNYPGSQSWNDWKTSEEDHSNESLSDSSAEATQNDSSKQSQNTRQDSRQYKCFKCGKVFRNKKVKELHESLHSIDKMHWR